MCTPILLVICIILICIFIYLLFLKCNNSIFSGGEIRPLYIPRAEPEDRMILEECTIRNIVKDLVIISRNRSNTPNFNTAYEDITKQIESLPRSYYPLVTTKKNSMDEYARLKTLYTKASVLSTLDGIKTRHIDISKDRDNELFSIMMSYVLTYIMRINHLTMRIDPTDGMPRFIRDNHYVIDRRFKPKFGAIGQSLGSQSDDAYFATENDVSKNFMGKYVNENSAIIRKRDSFSYPLPLDKPYLESQFAAALYLYVATNVSTIFVDFYKYRIIPPEIKFEIIIKYLSSHGSSIPTLSELVDSMPVSHGKLCNICISLLHQYIILSLLQVNHGDLKLDQEMVTDNGKTVILDFDIANIIDTPECMTQLKNDFYTLIVLDMKTRVEENPNIPDKRAVAALFSNYCDQANRTMNDADAIYARLRASGHNDFTGETINGELMAEYDRLKNMVQWF